MLAAANDRVVAFLPYSDFSVGVTMFFSDPVRSPYDWEFFFLGFPVRVTWTFWIFSAVFGYDWARGLDEFYFQNELDTPGFGVLLAIWIGVSFVSILIHELGHSLAMRYYGISSRIVLHHMGGLAIPDGAGGYRRSRITHWNQIAISAAGPGLQLAFGFAVAGVAFALGYPTGRLDWVLQSLGVALPMSEPFANATWAGLIDASIFTSIFWAVLNLLPVLPLDGGRIMQNLIGWYRRSSGFEEATNVSVLVCVIIVFASFQLQASMLAFFFMAIGIVNFQNLQNGTREF
jgi:Zn-dependent protease